MIIMMREIQTTGLGVTIDTIKVEMIALDIIICMAGQTAILHSMMTDATTTMITILHLVDNGKVKDSIKVKTRVIIIPVVTIGTLSMNEVTEARTEAIVNMTIPSVTLTINSTTSHTTDIGRTLNKTTLLRNPHCLICLASSPKMVLGLRLGIIRFFKTPAQKSNCTYYSVTSFTIEYVLHRYAFANRNKLQFTMPNICLGKVYIMLLLREKNRELFETDLIVQSNNSSDESTRITIQVNKHCMTELLLLDNTKVLRLFDSGSTVNLISESVIKSSEY